MISVSVCLKGIVLRVRCFNHVMVKWLSPCGANNIMPRKCQNAHKYCVCRKQLLLTGWTLSRRGFCPVCKTCLSLLMTRRLLKMLRSCHLNCSRNSATAAHSLLVCQPCCMQLYLQSRQTVPPSVCIARLQAYSRRLSGNHMHLLQAQQGLLLRSIIASILEEIVWNHIHILQAQQELLLRSNCSCGRATSACQENQLYCAQLPLASPMYVG